MAQIPHIHVEQTTVQTHTGDTTWQPISGASIDSSNFAAGRKYLLIFRGDFTGNDLSEEFSMRAVHGSDAFPGSVFTFEGNSLANAARHDYLWFKVWTAIDGESVSMQHKLSNAANTIRSRYLSILAMEISEELTENTDWFYSEQIASTALSTSWSSTGNAAVTFTPAGATSWLILATSQFNAEDVNNQMESRIERTGEATETLPTVSKEGEDATNGVMQLSLMRCYDLGAASNTFTQQSRNDAASNGTREYSAVFALRLNAFVDFTYAYSDSAVALSTSSWATLLHSETMAPAIQQDVYWLGWFAFEPATVSGTMGVRFRTQVDNVDFPDGTTAALLLHGIPYDVDDIHPCCIAGFFPDWLGSKTVDFDAYASENGASTLDRTLLVLGMELVEPPPPAPPPDPSALGVIGNVIIPTLAPGRGPSYTVPVESVWANIRQEPIDPMGTKVLPLAVRSQRIVSITYLGLVEDEKDYLENFFDSLLGPAGQFYFKQPNKVPSPLAITPMLDVKTVAGAPASQRTYTVRYTWFDPDTAQETKWSPAATLTVEAGDVLTVMTPYFPNGVKAFRIYAGENATPELQGHSTTRTWEEPVTGLVPGGGSAPLTNGLHPSLLYRLVDRLQITLTRFGRWDATFQAQEEWFAGS